MMKKAAWIAVAQPRVLRSFVKNKIQHEVEKLAMDTFFDGSKAAVESLAHGFKQGENMLHVWSTDQILEVLNNMLNEIEINRIEHLTLLESEDPK